METIMTAIIKETTSIKLDKEAKEQAKIIFKELGLTIGEAVNIFLRQVSLHQGIPFEIKIPNACSQQVIKEARLNKNVEEFSLDDLKR